MKYKVGDRVKIVSERVDKMNSAGEMDCWLGKIMTVEAIIGRGVRGYHMVEDDGQWFWNDGMIVGLAEPELTAEEAIRLLTEMCRSTMCADCQIHYHAQGNTCRRFQSEHPEKVVEILAQWKSDHEKKEPEVEWHFHAEVHGNGFDSVKNCDTEEEAIQFVEEELKKARGNAYGEYKRTCIVWER